MRAQVLIALSLATGCGHFPGLGGGSSSSKANWGNGNEAEGDAKAQKAPPADRAAPPANPELVVTGAGQKLTRLTTDPGNETWPQLSPDGKSLLFVYWTPEIVDGEATGNIAEQMVGTMNAATGNARTFLTSQRSFATFGSWLPGGSYVYLSNAMGKWNLVRALSKSAHSATSVVLDGSFGENVGGVRVSPDGKKVALHGVVRGQWMIAVCNINGSEFTLLTEGLNPAWSPDGQTLAFERQVGEFDQLFTVDVETGENLVQVTNDEAAATEPVWSPDGKYLVFVSNAGWNKFQDGSAQNTWNLFLVHPDGSGLTQLTDGAHHTADAFWGADGWIYFTSDNAGNYDLYKMKPPRALRASSA